jgi:putative hydrolase of the HAD superfamily
MSRRPLDIIFLDIDDTLYSTTNFTTMARKAALQAMIHTGIDMDLDTLTAELRKVTEHTPSNYEHHFDDLIKRLPPERIHHRETLIIAAAVVAYHRAKHRHLVIYEDAFHVIQGLHKRGVRIGIISSGLTVKQSEKIIRLEISPFLDPDAIFFTEEEGLQKEEPLLYQRACQKVGVSPERAMIIGDSARRDIDPPNQIGMITVLNKRSGKYLNITGDSEPDYTIHNFWDLEEILEKEFILHAE